MTVTDIHSRRGTNHSLPHDLHAEDGLLGAMLLSREAVAAGVAELNADQFYKPSNARIFAAITALFSRGEPVDVITTVDELDRSGHLDEVGGHSVLMTLLANAPASSNAARYAEIISEMALLRRLVTTGNQ